MTTPVDPFSGLAPSYSLTGQGGLLQGGTVPLSNPGAGFMPGYIGPAGTTAANAGGTGGLFSTIFGTLGSTGFQNGLSAFGNLANIYAGFKSLGLAEDQLDFAKSSFNKNFAASAKAYNNELKDQWEARTAGAAARGRSYEGMSSWLEGRTINEGG